MGPALKFGKKTIYPLKNFGVNLTGYIGSGTPFTRNSVAIPSVQSGVNLVNQIDGTPNGARRPWQFRTDLRADKSFVFGAGKKKEDGSVSRGFDFNVYITVLNLFDTRNVVSVYRFTGLPEDDGYLESGSGQQDIVTQIDPNSFVDQYRLRLQNPNNFSLPRRIRLGVLMNF